MIDVCDLVSVQNQVQLEVERKRQRTEEERTTSYRIALANPLVWPTTETIDKVAENSTGRVCFEHAPSNRDLSSASPPTAVSMSCQPQSFKFNFCSARNPIYQRKIYLPVPLSEEILQNATRELPQGSLAVIQRCIDCWTQRKLDDAELLSTVRSFSGASPLLKRLFSACGEHSPAVEQIATSEEMRQLASLAAVSIKAL